MCRVCVGDRRRRYAFAQYSRLRFTVEFPDLHTHTHARARKTHIHLYMHTHTQELEGPLPTRPDGSTSALEVCQYIVGDL